MENDFRDHRLILHLNWKFALHNNFDWVVCCAYVRLDLFTCVQISVTLVTTCAHITGGGYTRTGYQQTIQKAKVNVQEMCFKNNKSYRPADCFEIATTVNQKVVYKRKIRA
jgi:hypothetical protein